MGEKAERKLGKGDFGSSDSWLLTGNRYRVIKLGPNLSLGLFFRPVLDVENS